MTPEIEKVLAELKRQFQDLYGDRLVRMLLYGSHARGDARPGSDIDVLVVLRGSVSPCEEIVATVSLDYNETVSCMFVSENQYVSKRGLLLLEVGTEGISV